jgi:hypothetical protein
MFFFRDGEDKSARARSFTRAHKTTERDNSPRCAGTSKRSWPWSGHRRNRRRCSKLKEKYDLGEYKKAALMLPTKTKLRDRSREMEKGEKSLPTRGRRRGGERRERHSRKGENSKRTFGNLDHNYYVLFCVCVCVRACLKDEEKNSQRATFERWRERERC